MSGKPIVPGLIRRGNRFSVRVQVPKDLQKEVGKKEYWVKLGTEDRYEATSKALDVVRDKRAEFELTRRRLKGDYRHAEELTDDEISSLGREVFSSFLRQTEDAYFDEPEPTESEWERRITNHSERLQELEAEFARQRGRHDFAENLAEQVLDLNLIRLPKGSRSFKRLSELAFSAALEVERRILARLHGREFPDQIDPRFTTPDGQPRSFEAIMNRSTSHPTSITLYNLIVRYSESTHRSRTEKTRKSLRGYLEAMASIIGPGKDIRSVTHQDCVQAREIIEKLPPNFKKLKPFEKLPLKQVAEVATREGMQTLSPQGINNYVDAFYAFLRWCEGSQLIDRVPARRELLRVADPEKRDNKRLPFSADQLQTIFSTGAFETIDRDSAMFWVPLIALWNGMRSNEICQLDAADIRQEEGVWCFDITGVSTTGADDKTTKTESSVRVLPVHDRLLDIGLIDFHQNRPKNSKLFADIPRGADGYYSTVFSKRINRHFKKIGVHMRRKLVFHSLRHNFRDEMRRAEIDPGVARALGGWTNKTSEAFEIYGRGYSLKHLSSAIERIEYPSLNLAHLRMSV